MKILAALTAAALCATLAFADTLRLKDGSSVAGTFLGGDSRQVRFLDDQGSVKQYPVSDIAEIRFGTGAVSEPAAATPSQTAASGDRSIAGKAAIPQATVITVRMIDSIDSDVNGVGERFRASLEDAIVVDGKEIAPRGADAAVQITRVEQAGRIRGRDEITVELKSLTIDGREYELSTNFAQVESDGKTGDTARRAGVGAAAGAVIGAIAGGGRGAAIGAGAGAGAGTVYSATRGTQVRIPSETLLTFSLREPVNLLGPA